MSATLDKANSVLPEGANLFALIDERLESQLLVRFRTTSHRTTDEAFVAAQREALLELGAPPPEHKGELSDLLFYRTEFQLNPELMPRRRGLRGPKPWSIAHLDVMLAPGGKGGWVIVTDLWKSAIETFEPRVHEFFPLQIDFSNKGMRETRNVHVFRTRTALSTLRYNADHQALENISMSDFVSYGFMVRPTFRRSLPFTKSEVEGRHWFTIGSLPFASRQLAERLQPLLSEDQYLIPAILTN